MGKYKLIVLDMDGTCLNSHHIMSAKTANVLKRLSAKGVKIAFATGRSSLSVFSYLESLSLTQCHIPVICFNGSVCLTVGKDGTTTELFSYPLSKDSAQVLIAFGLSRGEVIQYYDGVSGIVYASPKTEEHRELLARYAQLTGKQQQYIESYDELPPNVPPAKMLILTKAIDELLADSARRLPVGMFHTIRGSPDPFFVEYLKPCVNKGASLVALSEHLGIALDEIIAFGDGDNDIEMLSCGCYGVAMQNARQNVKISAMSVTPYSNDEDGVALFLEELESEGRLSMDCDIS